MWKAVRARSLVVMLNQTKATPAATIVADRLTKRYGHRTVVDGLSFSVRPGRVTGLLGPNGAGKTQTLRMILGLVHPTSGSVSVGGLPLVAHPHPARVVGVVLDGGAFNPGRSARDSLRISALLAGVSDARVEELLDRVGLADDAHRKVGQYSLGMRQRLALAQALLAEPAVVIADEPANGLDPAGIAWLRGLLRELADGGTTVLLSSHLLSETERLVDDAVVLNRGRLVAHAALAHLVQDNGGLEQRFLQLTTNEGDGYR